MIPTELGFSERHDDDSGVRIGVRLVKGHLAFKFPGMQYEVRVELDDIDFFIKALTAIRESQGFDKLVYGPEEPWEESVPAAEQWSEEELAKILRTYTDEAKKKTTEQAKINDLLRTWPYPRSGCFPGQPLY